MDGTSPCRPGNARCLILRSSVERFSFPGFCRRTTSVRRLGRVISTRCSIRPERPIRLRSSGPSAASGTTNILNKITLGDGLASQMSMQIGRAGGNVGTGVSSIGTNDANNTAGSTTGCAGGVTGAIQMGGGNVAKPCVGPPLRHGVSTSVGYRNEAEFPEPRIYLN